MIIRFENGWVCQNGASTDSQAANFPQVKPRPRRPLHALTMIPKKSGKQLWGICKTAKHNLTIAPGQGKERIVRVQNSQYDISMTSAVPDFFCAKMIYVPSHWSWLDCLSATLRISSEGLYPSCGQILQSSNSRFPLNFMLVFIAL